MVMTPRPPMTSTPIPKPPADREQLEVSKLRSILEKEQSRPTIIPILEFKKFIPLFQNPKEFSTLKEKSLYDEQIIRLTDQYMTRIDKYKETHVVDQQGTVILKIPPLFVQFSSLAPTRENDEAVLINRKFSRSDIPKFSMQALARLNEALIAQQKDEKQTQHIEQVKKQTHQLLDEFYIKKLRTNTDKPETKPDEPSVDTSTLTPSADIVSIPSGRCTDL